MSLYRIGAFASGAALLVTLSVVSSSQPRAQTAPGDLRGVVRNSQQAVLPGVTVILSRSSVANQRTITDAKGEFSFIKLDPGRYTVTARLTGFKDLSKPVDVAGGRTTRVTLDLAVAAISESVKVTASAPVLDASTAALARQVSPGAGGGSVIGGLGWPQFNTEAYDRVNENQWTSVAQDPLSTFSADVDTASYSNVRRFLRDGQAPPKDAVRIEELINYFRFAYAEPNDGRPFAITTAVGECPWSTSHRLALIGLQARKIDASRIPPRNLVFLIDVSGSMFSPNKLPLVKASLAMLAPNLTGKDRVAIVVYAGNTGLVLPSTSGADTSTILEALARLEAGGSTDGGAGLQLAYKVAQDHFIKGGVNRVVLATDGDFNVGVTDQGSLLRLIEEKRKSGVALSVLGFGMGNLKDSTMVKLADAGNGNYAYIDSLTEAQKVLVEEAGGTLVTVAKDVKLQVEFNPREVAAYRLIGYEKRILKDQDFNDDKKDAGEMGAGHSVTALYEVIPAGQPIDVPKVDPLKYQTTPTTTTAGNGELMTVKVRYKDPDGDVSRLMNVPVPNRVMKSADLGFAAAVIEFGMLLRDSDFKGSASFQSASALAAANKSEDSHGHRAEFIRLIGAAEGVSRLQTTAQR
jgi:Ca-activated chloride channel family protein